MKANSCPNCEYEHGKHGKPVTRGDTIHCLECGTSWKNISANPSFLIEDNSREKTFTEMRNMLREHETEVLWSDASYEAVTLKQNSIDMPGTAAHSTNVRFPVGLMAVAVALFVGLGALTMVLTDEKIDQSVSQQIVSLSDVEYKEQISRTGRKVITVKGLVQNASDEYQPLRPISIILRRKDGAEIIRWRHVSQKAILKAGAKSRFASSIQYDTPLVAYAEAVFE